MTKLQTIQANVISAVCLVDDKGFSHEIGVMGGEYQVVFTSPEALSLLELRNMLA